MKRRNEEIQMKKLGFRVARETLNKIAFQQGVFAGAIARATISVTELGKVINDLKCKYSIWQVRK